MRAIVRPLRMARRSLEARLVGSFLALSLVTLTIVATVAYGSARRGLAEALENHLASVSAHKETELDRWVQGELRVLELLAGQAHVGPGGGLASLDPEELQHAVEHAAQAREDFAEVFVLSPAGGRIVASTGPERVGRFHTTEPFFELGRERSYVQQVYHHPFSGRPTLTIATPVVDEGGVTTAVLAAHLSLDRVERIVDAAADVYASAEAYLVTETNEVLSAARFGLPEFRRGVHSQGIAAALTGATGVDLYESYRGVPVIGVYRWLPEHSLALLVEVSQEEAFAPARTLLGLILLFGVAATLTLLVGVRLIALRVVRPITAVAASAARVADGDFSALAPVHGDDEVGDLARSFNAMTERLRALYADLEEQVDVSTTALSALEASRSLLRSIIDNSTALIAVCEPTGRVMIANRPLQQLLDVSEGEYLGEPLDRLLPPEVGSAWREAWTAGDDPPGVIEREVEWPTTEGTRTYLCIWFPLSGDGVESEGIGMIATDLTERRRVEEERRRIEDQFRHAQKLESLGVLAGGIAHDFNNILAAILGHADLAIACMADDPDETADHLEQVAAAARRAADLTNQMLAYAGKASFRMEALDLNQSIREMSELLRVSLPKKVTLQTELSPDPLPIRGDPAQISQLVVNLVTNAAQAIGGEAGVVTVSTAPSVNGQGAPRAVLRVQDTGCGMDAETLERIFDPFYTTREGGRGLGLAAVLGIVKSLDGTLDVESEPGRGTNFRIAFPVDASVDEPEPTAPLEAVEEAGEGTILVVDDEPAVRSVAKRTLERSGFTVVEARDGLEALDVFRRLGAHVDAVVLDMSMPGMGGREVFDVLRQADRDLPVLFTSGYDPSDAADTLLDAPHVRFLQKPYRPADLGEEVERLLAGVA